MLFLFGQKLSIVFAALFRLVAFCKADFFYVTLCIVLSSVSWDFFFLNLCRNQGKLLLLVWFLL